MRAVVIGFPKSGTTTLQTAIQRSGLRSVHWRRKGGEPIGKLIYDGWFEDGDPFARLPGVDVITQMDICVPKEKLNYWPNLDIALLLAIRERHPDCLMILNARDPAKIADSILRWGDLARRIARGAQPGLPEGRGAERAELERWIGAHHAAVRRIFAGDPHFLDLDIAAADAPARLGAALGVTVKWWGRANENPRPVAA
jgi:hypothetical protein